MRSRASTSIEASSTVSKSGSFGIRNGTRAEAIGGADPSAQNSGLRRFCILASEFLLFLRDALKELDDAAANELTPLLVALPGDVLSSTGR